MMWAHQERDYISWMWPGHIFRSVTSHLLARTWGKQSDMGYPRRNSGSSPVSGHYLMVGCYCALRIAKVFNDDLFCSSEVQTEPTEQLR
jgi:hypothetical protein